MKWYEYDNLMSWDKDDLATTIIELVDDLKLQKTLVKELRKLKNK
tara:strand:+ start:42 stop:176 length:135 start_codon:yes stop_codon:yes gene_type:complete